MRDTNVWLTFPFYYLDEEQEFCTLSIFAVRSEKLNQIGLGENAKVLLWHSIRAAGIQKNAILHDRAGRTKN